MFRTTNFQLIEVVINAQNSTGLMSKIPIPQQPQLQTPDKDGKNVYIKAIETFSSTAYTVSPISPALPVASPFDMSNMILTLLEGTSENKKQMSFMMLNRIASQAVGAVNPPIQLFLLKNVYTIDWTSSYVNTLTIPPVLPYSALIGVHYAYDPDLY